MRKTIILLCLTVILLAGAAHLYRDPRVKQLFRSAPRVARTVEHKRHVPEQSATPQPADRPADAGTQSTAAPADEPEGTPRSLVPNETVGRILLQVLAARGLSSGISLEVSDRAIRVYGEVESAEKRRTILAVINKGREARRVDGSGLVIRN